MAKWRRKPSRGASVAAGALALAFAPLLLAQAQPYKPTPSDRCHNLAAQRFGADAGSSASPLLHELVAQIDEARSACEQAVLDQPKGALLHARLARVLALAGDGKGAVAAARRAMELGSASALTLLGVMHVDGIHLPRDYAAALDLFRKAARAGDPLANFNLGVMQANGWGLTADAKDAAGFFNLAARGRDPLAMQIVGQKHAADPAQAEQLWKRAAEAMDPESHPNPMRIAKLGRADLDKAALLAWYEERARAGELWAQAYMGMLYESGQWVKQDYQAAAAWYRRAGEAGNVAAQWRMQRFYTNGWGVARDPVEARRWGQMSQVMRCDALERSEPGANACDRLAGDPYDPMKVVPGVDSFCMRQFAERAVAACKAAVSASASTVRFRAQYARALAHVGDFGQARREAAAAAKAGATPAMILIGVMDQRGLGGAQNEAQALAWYRKAAALGDRRAASLVSASAMSGIGVAKDSPEAKALLEAMQSISVTQAAPSQLSLAEKGDMRAQHNIAAEFERQKNYAEALKWYARAAQQGYALSEMNLAQMYEKGIGVRQDDAEAAARYRQLAERGNSEARYRLAGLSAKAGNHAEAAKLYGKGVEHDEYRSMLDLAQMYEEGRGVSKNLRQAASLYERAADRSRWAHFKLGGLYFQGVDGKPDYPKALQWWQKAADQGNPAALNNLGVLHERGLGVKVDYAKARELYLAALKAGVPEAKGNAESLFDQGRGAPKDAAQAVAWYRTGAEAGVATAQYRLGNFYAKGQGVARDDLEAVKWLSRAAEQGHAKARTEAADLYLSIGQRYEQGVQGFPRDERAAMEAYLAAAALGSTRAIDVIRDPKVAAFVRGLAAKAAQQRAAAGQMQWPSGVRFQPGEDQQRTLQVRAAATGVSHAAVQSIASVYDVIPWFPEADGKRK